MLKTLLFLANRMQLGSKSKGAFSSKAELLREQWQHVDFPPLYHHLPVVKPVFKRKLKLSCCMSSSNMLTSPPSLLLVMQPGSNRKLAFRLS